MRIRNALLGVCAVLLFLNLWFNFFSTAQAVPRKYKAVDPQVSGLYDAANVQRTLDQQSVEGWEYVGTAGVVLIFKK